MAAAPEGARAAAAPRAKAREAGESGMKQMQEHPKEPKTVMVQYQVTVRTSDRAHADTAAAVFVVLHGTGAGPGGEIFPTRSGALPLVIPLDDTKQPFRRGAESVFMVTAPDVGTVIGCRIGHLGGGGGRLDGRSIGRSSDWSCADVAITETAAGETAAFPCNQWISNKSKDGTSCE